MHEEDMLDVAQHLNVEALAEVLDEMEPDTAADLLGELEPGAFGPGNLRCASVARRLGPGDWSKARAGAVALGPGAGAAAAPVTPAGGRSQTIAMSQNSAEVLRTPRPK